ncbi:MAG: hypothetical protein V7719_02500 [Psychroserpens sp.]|uniref:hypothetical protein n=1 Tax=Psychroserpens sp. TaxID=2020870 RepID=UPI0030014808
MKKIKPLALIFCFLIFFQSCSVYKPTYLTLEQLSETDGKVMIKTNDKSALKFKQIEFIDGRYYGVKKNSSKRILIFEKDIESIELRDKKASIRKTLIVSILGIGILFLIVNAGLGGEKVIK